MLKWLNAISRVFGLEIVRANEMRRLREATELFLQPSVSRSEVPEDAAAYLDPGSPTGSSPRAPTTRWQPAICSRSIGSIS